MCGVHKTREELIERKIIGEKDYQLPSGSWTERYETLVRVRQDNLIKNKYTIYESDGIKGIRITIVDKATGAIIRETK